MFVKERNSEFARPLTGPALDDYLFVGEEFDGVAALCVHHAEEAAFPSGEREVRHRRRDADVDADVAGGDGVSELASRGTRSGEDRTGVSVCRAVNHGKCFFDGSSVDHREDGTEDFRFHQRAGGGKSVKDGGPDEGARVTIGLTATVDDGLRALIRTLTNERDNTIAACTRNHRTHLGDGIEAIAHFQ